MYQQPYGLEVDTISPASPPSSHPPPSYHILQPTVQNALRNQIKEKGQRYQFAGTSIYCHTKGSAEIVC